MASDRFADDLARLTRPDEPIGLAVSGGPDSLALLLLAHAVAPGRLAVATVDHGLRPEAGAEAAQVAAWCAERDIPQDTLVLDWPGGAPTSNVQASARTRRYDALTRWAINRNITTIATGHHRDDVIETFLMRALRGAGTKGLAAMAETRDLGDGVRVVRPLLGWTREDLAAVVAEAGLTPVEDPANRDPAYDRARLRNALAAAALGSPDQIADSAQHLREAETALAWTAERLAEERLRPADDGVALVRGTIPDELLRRLLLIAFARLGDRPPRGPDLSRAIATLEAGGQCVLGATLLRAEDDRWVMAPAPPRQA